MRNITFATRIQDIFVPLGVFVQLLRLKAIELLAGKLSVVINVDVYGKIVVGRGRVHNCYFLEEGCVVIYDTVLTTRPFLGGGKKMR